MFNSVKSENAFSHNNKRSVKRVKTREGDNKRRWMGKHTATKKMPISVFTCVIVHLSEYTIFFSIEDTTISDRLNGRGFFFSFTRRRLWPSSWRRRKLESSTDYFLFRASVARRNQIQESDIRKTRDFKEIKWKSERKKKQIWVCFSSWNHLSTFSTRMAFRRDVAQNTLYRMFAILGDSFLFSRKHLTRRDTKGKQKKKVLLSPLSLSLSPCSSRNGFTSLRYALNR